MQSRIDPSLACFILLAKFLGIPASNAVTVVIDLFFTVVFFAVMFAYSPLLMLIVVLSIACYVAISMAISPAARRTGGEVPARGSEGVGCGEAAAVLVRCDTRR